jgi:3-carboxy-cis,cis-muconate cycloisomerase
MEGHAPLGLLDVLFSTEKVRDILSDRARLQGMLDFEAALARAEAATGVIPRAAVAAIQAQCRAESFDLVALARGTALGGNIAIPMVKALTAAVATSDAESAKFVHWGATSQDAIDTGLVLQLRAVLDLFDADLAKLSAALATLCRTHRATPLAGRTWLQQATPVTLGLKAAGWLSAIDRHRARLRESRPRLLVVQFGGAVGTLAALGDRGLDVLDALARELDLDVGDVPWHTHRDRLAEVATVLGLLTGTLGKIARDVSLLMQTEVGEVFEPSAPGKGGSSTLPHKRNPVGSAVILGAALRVPALVSIMLTAMVQEHERGMGNWHAEWQTLPEIASLASGALAQTLQIVSGIEVDAARMASNLELTHGLILAEAVTMALGTKIGRLSAHHLVEHACRIAVERHTHLRDVLCADAEVSKHLSADDITRLLDPSHYTGQAGPLVDRALAKAST